MGKKGKSVKKGKKPHKNKPTSKKYTKYTIENGSLKRERFCPRCGPGVFLSHSQGRHYCGKCHYTLFETGKKEIKDEASPEKK